jgi:hypothetical protein
VPFAVAACLVPLAAYVFLLGPTIVGGDSPELVTAAWVTGVPHPPGYPLYTMLGKLFGFIPMGSVAWRVNLMSAVLDALCCLLVYLGLRRAGIGTWAALGGALFLAFSRFFWMYSEVAEVFALNNFFAALLAYLALRWRQGAERWVALAFGLALGLSFTNHQTIVFLVPGLLALMLWRAPRPPWPAALACFALGTLAYAYVPLAARANPPLDWDHAVTVDAFKKLVLRQEYGTLALMPGGQASLPRWMQLPTFLSALAQAFTPLGLALALVGAWAARRSVPLMIFLASSFILSGPFFVMLANLNFNKPEFMAVIQRFYILPCVLLAYCIGFGAERVFALRPRLAPVLLALLLIWPLASNWRYADQRHNTLAMDLAANMLDELPPDSLLLIHGEVPTMAVDYAQMVEGRRPDVVTLAQNKLMLPWYIEQVRARHGAVRIPGGRYSDSHQVAAAIAAANVERRPVFANHLPKSDLTRMPWGLLERCLQPGATASPSVVALLNARLLERMTVRNLDQGWPKSSWETLVVDRYARLYSDVGVLLQREAVHEKAAAFYERAMQIKADYAPPYKNLAILAFDYFNDRERGRALLRRYLELAPQDPQRANIEKLIKS